MKYLSLSTFVLSLIYFFTPQLAAQTNKLTPAIVAKIKVRVDSAAQAFKKNYKVHDGDNPDDLDFTLDTFKIERYSEYALDYDYSTVGMNAIVDNATVGYDKLLNKFYKKLLAVLKEDDKQTLINAQREWLKFKELDINLIGTISQPKYSGGGSIQSNLNTGAINEIVKQRAITMYHYFSRIQEK